MEQVTGKLGLMALKEAGHAPDLRHSLTGNLPLRFGGFVARAGFTGRADVGIGARTQLLKLPFVVRELGMEAPKVSFSRAATVLTVKVLGSAPRGCAEELLIASRIRTREVLSTEAKAVGIGHC